MAALRGSSSSSATRQRDAARRPGGAYGVNITPICRSRRQASLHRGLIVPKEHWSQDAYRTEQSAVAASTPRRRRAVLAFVAGAPLASSSPRARLRRRSPPRRRRGYGAALVTDVPQRRRRRRSRGVPRLRPAGAQAERRTRQFRVFQARPSNRSGLPPAAHARAPPRGGGAVGGRRPRRMGQVFSELVRQVFVGFSDRGELLGRVRRAHAHYLTSLADPHPRGDRTQRGAAAAPKSTR